jgi:hypothetical protein
VGQRSTGNHDNIITGTGTYDNIITGTITIDGAGARACA